MSTTKKPYKQTPKTVQILLQAISEGLTQRDASILAGISEDTLSLWKRDNSDFSEQMRQKEIEFKHKNIKIIQEASSKSWQASAWLLERKFKDEFAIKPNRNEVSEDFRQLMDYMKENVMVRKPRKTS